MMIICVIVSSLKTAIVIWKYRVTTKVSNIKKAKNSTFLENLTGKAYSNTQYKFSLENYELVYNYYIDLLVLSLNTLFLFVY